MTELDAWLVALAALGTLGPALVWLAYELTRPGPDLPPYGRQVVPMDGTTVPVTPPPPPVPVYPLAWGEYTGRHRPEVLSHSWPAAEVRQITAATGEWAVVDITGAQWGERYELVATGDSR